MRIFLSGKMDATHGAWRDSILGWDFDYQTRQRRPKWEIVRSPDDYGESGFPQAPNTHVLGLHEYVGPYRLTYDRAVATKNTGYFHGSTGRGQHGEMDEEDHADIVSACLSALDRADLVFAYLNTPDCFGTIAEIAYAAARGKYVHLVVLSEAAQWEDHDYWFVERLCARTRYVWSGDGQGRTVEEEVDIKHFFRDALVTWTARAPQFASPSGQVTLVRPVGISAELAIVLNSFSQIARWTADPRVRTEAERMVRRLSAG